ncbi:MULTISPECIES: hypothetical protein [unclassified Microcoleus]|uniref:hypothetical protein n=1 Tax=unclassified Microcoleus TaxID=2642155 RepID=UPI0025E2F51B|nr:MULTISPECIES: hypothetical protein [unclassified Microcoleus]
MRAVKLNNRYSIAAAIYYQVITNVAGQSQQPSGYNRIKGGGFYDFRLENGDRAFGTDRHSPNTRGFKPLLRSADCDKNRV